MPLLHDITMPLRDGTPGWPGDVPYAFAPTATQADGASANVGSITTSLHAGTHADAPFHFDPAGATIDQLGLDAFVGPALLLDVAGVDVIEIADLDRAAATLGGPLRTLLRDAPRLLLRTGSWPDRSRFPDRIATLSPLAAAALAGLGVRLLGVDVPSVDPLDSKTLDVHHALHRGHVAIVENLLLDAVPPGTYELVALPLRLAGADGAPVRAVLLERSA